MTTTYAFALFLTVLLVYSLKAFRLYFLVSGEGVVFSKFLAAFSLTAFLNIVIPFKLGELFRFFVFGHLVKNYLKGFAVVLLDRFVDIVSLLFVFVIMKFLGQAEFSWIFFFLLFASVFLILFYSALQNLLVFWNEYFIKSAPSKRHLNALAFLKNVSVVYGEVKNLISGRFFAIFTISVFSWGIEIASLVLCRRFFDFDSENLVARYLSAALTGKSFLPLENFIRMSVIFLGAIFVISILIVLLKGGLQFASRTHKLNHRARFWGEVKNEE